MNKKISELRQVIAPPATDTIEGNKLVSTQRIPGVRDFWMLIAAEITLFSFFFITYMISRNQDLALFQSSQQTLDSNLGAFNTAVLILGSWSVTQAVLALRLEQASTARHHLTFAVGSGLVFGGVKCFEYADKFAHGLFPVSNDFFMFYFVLTFIHMFHLIAGTVALEVMRRGVIRGIYHRDNMAILESAAIYWHLVDFLWIFLFALFYMLR